MQLFLLKLRPSKKMLAACLSAAGLLAIEVKAVNADALASYRFKQGMVYGLGDIDQSTIRFSTGSLFGLSDDKGRAILPIIYSDIEYCGHGLFLATDAQKWNKYCFGDKRHFFNRDGIELHYKIPDKAFLLNILSFGERADLDSSETLSALPEDTILLFDYREEPEKRQLMRATQGLCNLAGKILFKVDAGIILFYKPGYAFVCRDTGDNSILNLKDLSETPTKMQREVGKVPSTRIHWPNNYQVPMPFPKDRRRPQVFTDDGLFDREYWCDRRNFPIEAIDMFNRFLHDYDLIGMRVDKVDILLGDPATHPEWIIGKDSRTYRFPQVGCVPHFTGIKMYLENEHVVGWSFVDADPYNDHKLAETAKVTTNVVLKRPTVMTARSLVNGRIGEQTSAWPELEPKLRQ